MSEINVYIIGDPGRAPTRLFPASDEAPPVETPLILRATIPAESLSHGQLTAFIRDYSCKTGDVERNVDGLYYEASLNLKFPNGDECFVGKLSKSNKCLHWEGQIDLPKDGVLVVEADWREYRMQALSKSETKENSTASTTPKAKKASIISHLKRKRSPLTVKVEQQRSDVSTVGATEVKSGSDGSTTPSCKKSKATSVMSPAARKASKPSTVKTSAAPTSGNVAKTCNNRAKKTAVDDSGSRVKSSPTTVYNPNTASGTFLNMLLAAKDDDDEEEEDEVEEDETSAIPVIAQSEKKPAQSRKKKSKTPTRHKSASEAEAVPVKSSAKFLVQALLQNEEEGKSKTRDADDSGAEFELLSSGVLEPSPSVRWGHSQCLVTSPSGNHVVVIGGQTVKNSFCRDATWLYDPSFGEWEALETGSGGASSPGMRMGHSSVFDAAKNCIFVYGGSKNCRWFKDMHMLSLDKGGWQELKTTGEAPTRAYHSAILHRSEIWIFGGVFPNPGTEPDGCSNGIEVYSSETGGWYSPEVTGQKPLPRSGHSASLLGDKMLIFGGWDMPAIFNDVHVFDLTFAEWTTPNDIQGSPPPARCWHASALIARPHPRLFIHGGFNGDRPLSDAWVLDLPAGISNSPSITSRPQWTKISIPDLNLNARAGHSALSVIVKTADDGDGDGGRNEDDDDDDEEERIVLFGGGNNNGDFFNTTTVIRAPSRVELLM